jgi:hypothetical protein
MRVSSTAALNSAASRIHNAPHIRQLGILLPHTWPPHLSNAPDHLDPLLPIDPESFSKHGHLASKHGHLASKHGHLASQVLLSTSIPLPINPEDSFPEHGHPTSQIFPIHLDPPSPLEAKGENLERHTAFASVYNSGEGD